MISVGTNIGSFYAQAAGNSAVKGIDEAMERLATGKRINAAKDDAAGVAIASRMTSKVIAMNQGIRNSLDAQALINTAEGGLKETDLILQRIRELAVQASNDTNSSADRNNLNIEAQQLLASIDAIASGTTWAGQNLLDGSFSSKTFQVGSGTMETDQIITTIKSATTNSLGLSAAIANVSVAALATLDINAQQSTGQLITNSVSNVGKASKQLISLPKTISLEKSAQTVFASPPNKADVAALADDRFVVVQGSQGQIYSAAGDKEGNVIAFSGINANVEALPGGGFVVALDNSDKLEYFNSQGVRQRSVNIGFTLSNDIEVSVNDQGQVLVVSKNNNYMAAQLFSSTGDYLSGSFVVPGTSGLESYEPRDFGAAQIGDNKFIISWVEGDDFNNPPEIVKAVIIDSNTLPAQPNAFVKGQFYPLSATPSPFTVIQQPNGYEVESIDVFALADGTAWISYGIEQAGLAGNVDAKRYDSNGQLVQTGGYGPVSREYITNTEMKNYDTLYFEDTAVRREVTLSAPDSGSLSALRINRNNIYVSHGDTNSAVAANSDRIFMLGNTNSVLSREVYRIQQTLSAGSYSLTVAGTTLSGTVGPGSTDQANDLVFSLKNDPNYDPSKYDIVATGGNITVEFVLNGAQSPIILKNSANVSMGRFSEIQAGESSTKEIDLSSFNFGADGYILSVGNIELFAPPNSGGVYDIDTLISAITSDVNYDPQVFSVSKNLGNLMITFSTQSFTSDVNLRSLPSYSVSLSGVNLDGSAHNLNLGQVVLTAPALNSGVYSISSLVTELKKDGDYDSTKYLISVEQDAIKIISLDGLEYSVSLDNADPAAGSISGVSGGSEISLNSHANAQRALTRVDAALETVNSQRATLGALSNRLDHTVANNTNLLVNAQASLARIMDADYALESTRLAKHQILQQASVAMLAQANASKQSILQLLEAR